MPLRIRGHNPTIVLRRTSKQVAGILPAGGSIAAAQQGSGRAEQLVPRARRLRSPWRLIYLRSDSARRARKLAARSARECRQAAGTAVPTRLDGGGLRATTKSYQHPRASEFDSWSLGSRHERELPGEGVVEPFSKAALLVVRIESPYVASAT